MPDIKVPITLLLTREALTHGKQFRPSLLWRGFFLGRLNASRVLVLVRPCTPITSSLSYLVPAIGDNGCNCEGTNNPDCRGSDPTLGEEVGSMIDRVDEGDLRPG